MTCVIKENMANTLIYKPSPPDPVLQTGFGPKTDRFWFLPQNCCSVLNNVMKALYRPKFKNLL